MTIDPEAESEAVRRRSQELAAMLDGAHPVLDQAPLREVKAQAVRLGREAHAARRQVAHRLAAGMGAGADVTIGRPPVVRRIKTDNRGKDLDPLGGRCCITPALKSYWEFQRDTVAPAIEAAYRQALESPPYREALVSAARAHIELMRLRRSMLTEGGQQLEAAVINYDGSFRALREGFYEAQTVRQAAVDRLSSLDREQAQALIADPTTTVQSFIASAAATILDQPVDAASGAPLEAVDGRTGRPRQPAPTAGPQVHGRSVPQSPGPEERSPRPGTPSRELVPVVGSHVPMEPAYKPPKGPVLIARGGEITGVR